MSSALSTSKAPPPGWVVLDGQLTADAKVAGYLARGTQVKGICHQRDCRRRCEIDLGMLVARGLGALAVGDLKPLLKCGRLGGCALEVREEPAAEIRLRQLTGKGHVTVRFMCQGCRKATTAPAEAVIGRLKTEGTGGADTAVSKLAELVRGACKGCGVKRWRVDVMWEDPEGAPRWRGKAAGGR